MDRERLVQLPLPSAYPICSELRRRRNNRRQQQQQQHGGGDLRIPDQAIMVGDIGRRMITFDNGLHEGILVMIENMKKRAHLPLSFNMLLIGI